MMKRNFFYLNIMLLFILTVSACKKSEVDPYMGNPDERLNETLTNFSNQLTDAQFGWKGYLVTEENGVFAFMFNFSDENRVSMITDIDPTAPEMESSYRLKALQRPTLLFDTYSYLHLLADPDPGTLGGATGSGYSADFEFEFTKSSADTIELEGVFFKSKLILIRSKSQDDSSNFFPGIASVVNSIASLRTYFKRVTINGIECELIIDTDLKIMSVSYLKDGSVITHRTPFIADNGNAILVNPVSVEGLNVTEFRSLSVQSTGTVSAMVNGSSVQIKESAVPLHYDETSASRFYNAPANSYYWQSYTGFTIDGINDAYGLRNIPNFSFLLYYPKYNAAYSRLGFIVNQAYAAYGPAPVAQITTGGIIKFTNFGSFGTAPASIRPIITNTSNKWFEAEGFYVIPTSSKSYVLVNVKDARAWINFY